VISASCSLTFVKPINLTFDLYAFIHNSWWISLQLQVVWLLSFLSNKIMTFFFLHQTWKIIAFVLQSSQHCYFNVFMHFTYNMSIIGASFPVDFYMWVSTIRGQR
jgi:hypothetical protein